MATSQLDHLAQDLVRTPGLSGAEAAAETRGFGFDRVWTDANGIRDIQLLATIGLGGDVAYTGTTQRGEKFYAGRRVPVQAPSRAAARGSHATCGIALGGL